MFGLAHGGRREHSGPGFPIESKVYFKLCVENYSQFTEGKNNFFSGC